MTKFRIEHLGRDGRWHIVAGGLAERDARYHCARYRRLYANSEFRIVEEPPRPRQHGQVRAKGD